MRIGRLHVSQLRLVGIDIVFDRVKAARHQTRAHNQRVGVAAADACRLPFRDAVFDATFCVAVLQHLADVEVAVRECARVTAAGGRLLLVEPDYTTRCSHAGTPAGVAAFAAAERLFAAVASTRGDATDPAVGPKLPAICARHGVEPLAVRLFPVSQVHLGQPPAEVWARRRDAAVRITDQAPSDAVRELGRDYQRTLAAYEIEAGSAGAAFVEIQNTILVATVGQKPE